MNTKICASFVKARGYVNNPPLDCQNPHFKNRYASLAATLDEIKKACRMSDIVYIQFLEKDNEGFVLKSYVIDSDGGRMELSTFPVSQIQDPQKFGSEMTYKKRQQAQADWGIVGEEDDDGEAASRPNPKQDDRLASVRQLYKRAVADGVSPEGIESWMISRMGCGLSDMSKLDSVQIVAVESYLKDMIEDMRTIKESAA